MGAYAGGSWAVFVKRGGFGSLFLLCSLGGGGRWAPHLSGAESEVWGATTRCRRWWGRGLGLVNRRRSRCCAQRGISKVVFPLHIPYRLRISTHFVHLHTPLGGDPECHPCFVGESAGGRWKHCSHFYTIVFGLSIPINNLPPHPFAMDGALARATKMLFLAGRQLQLRLWCELQARGWWCWWCWYIKLAAPGRRVSFPTSK